MEARNCPRCKKMFNYIKSPLCPACEKNDEDEFQALRTFIDENPSCNSNELHKGTGVTLKKIMSYIREGRLEISQGMHGEIKCDSCGTPILRGKYCDNCVIKINQKVNNLFSDSVIQTKTSNRAKMHIRSDKRI